jgi:hypothetical protein
MLASVGGLAVSLYAAPSKAVKEYITVCDPSEDGADCRRDQLAKDNQGLGLDYSKVSAPKETKISSTAVRSSDGFDKATRELIVKVRAYNELTPFDKERPRLADELKTESNAWVAKYSPGGSCSYESGRDFYSALSALVSRLQCLGTSARSRFTCDERACAGCAHSRAINMMVVLHMSSLTSHFEVDATSHDVHGICVALSMLLKNSFSRRARSAYHGICLPHLTRYVYLPGGSKVVTNNAIPFLPHHRLFTASRQLRSQHPNSFL